MREFICLIQVNSGFFVKSCNLVTTYLQRKKNYRKSLGSKLACLKNQFLLPYIIRQCAWDKVTQRQSVCFCSSFYMCFHTSLLCYHGSPWVQKALVWPVRQLVSLHARCLASFPLWNVSLLHLPLLPLSIFPMCIGQQAQKQQEYEQKCSIMFLLLLFSFPVSLYLCQIGLACNFTEASNGYLSQQCCWGCPVSCHWTASCPGLSQ